MSPAALRQRKLAYFAWIAVCLIWGTTYLGIRVSLETMPPALMGGLRWTLAGALLAGWVLIRGEKLPPVSQLGLDFPPRLPDARSRQRWRRVRRAVGPERTDGSSRRHVAVLDGRRRGRHAGWRATETHGHRRARHRIQRDRAPGVAGVDAQLRPAIPDSSRGSSRSRSRRSVGRSVLPTPRDGGAGTISWRRRRCRCCRAG